jgi:hypothetical protein
MTRETQSLAGNELDEELEFSDLDSTASMFKVLQRVKKLKLRDTKGDSGEKINEFEAIKEEIGNALNAKDFKGKNYVIDKEGRLLTVDPVRPESLPPFAVPLKTTISEKSIDDGHLRVMKKKKVIRVAGSPALNDSYFTASSTLATTLAGGEKIDFINAGVSIHNGENVRRGESFPSDPRRANRKEYLKVGSSGGNYNASDDSFMEGSLSRSPGASPGTALGNLSSVYLFQDD